MPTHSGTIEQFFTKEGKKGLFATVKIDGYFYLYFNEDDIFGDEGVKYDVGDYVKYKWFESSYEQGGETKKSRVIKEMEKMEKDEQALNAQTSGYPEQMQDTGDIKHIKAQLQSIENIVGKDYEDNQQTLYHLTEALGVLNTKMNKVLELLCADTDQFKKATLFEDSNARS